MKKHLMKFRGYLVRTYKNKIMAMGFMLLGYISTFGGNDGNFFAFTLLFGLPLFIMDEVEEDY